MSVRNLANISRRTGFASRITLSDLHLHDISRKTRFACPIRNTSSFGSMRKGQFFLLGAFLISTLFFVGLPRPATLSVEGMEDLSYLSLNLQKEMPNAFNLGLKQGDYLSVMRNFTWFAERILKERRVAFGALVCFGSNISTTDFNVTIFNYIGTSQAVNITIGSSMYEMLIANNQSNSTSFTSVGTLLNISFKYAREEKNMTWVRDKYSIYGMVNLTRRDSVIIKDFEG